MNNSKELDNACARLAKAIDQSRQAVVQHKGKTLLVWTKPRPQYVRQA
jgi:hypothetical protein